MSQETNIGNLTNNISEEDSRLVDTILNDINNSGNNQPQVQQNQGKQLQGNQMTEEQMKMMLERETGPSDRFSSSFG